MHASAKAHFLAIHLNTCVIFLRHINPSDCELSGWSSKLRLLLSSPH